MEGPGTQLRKIVVELDPQILESSFGVGGIFRTVESMEFKQILQLDLEQGIKVLIEEINMRPGHQLKDVEFPEGIEILGILKREGNRYVVLMKSSADAFMRKLIGLDWHQAKNLPPISEAVRLESDAQLNVVPDPPIFISKEKAVFGFLGDRQSIDAMLKLLRFFGVVKGVHFPRTGPYEYDVLSSLTERQREVITTAQKHGYYEYPRRISTQELAGRLGMTKTTLIEHLRKAENTLVSSIVAGF